MEKVKILKPLFVVQTGLQYREGEEVEVPKYLAERHTETGFMQIVTLEKAIPLDKKKDK